jgi:hypothetical protein
MSTTKILTSILLSASLATPALAGAHARAHWIRNDSGLVVFDEPNATGGTKAHDINEQGDSAGEYTAADHQTYGFLRLWNGSFAEIKVDGHQTFALALNDSDVVVGQYDANGTEYAFVRRPSGSIATINLPDSIGAVALHVNKRGTVTGDFTDSTGTSHGFIRDKNGGLTVFDDPNAPAGDELGTFAGATNVRGDTAGHYYDENFDMHAYIRHNDGTFTEFGVPGANGTFPYTINTAGWIVGFSYDQNGATHGYVRRPDGRIVTVDAPGAGSGGGQGTVVDDMSPVGIATGYYVDANNVSHGFLWSKADGVFKEFDAPGAGPRGTTPVGVNNSGTVAGWEFDQNGLARGIIGMP